MFTLLITFFVISILFSFLCSLWEAVLLSITPTYAHVKMEQGSSIGHQLKAFKENIDRPLAAILTLNTIAHTVGAIGVGAQAAAIWSETHPIITQLVVPVVMTLAILIISEIIPKTIGANYWQELAPFTVRSLQLIIAVLAPLVWMSQLITKTLKKDKSRSVLSRSDFMVMAQLGAKEGVFEESESHIISNMLKFNTIRAEDIMTPRTVVIAASESMTVEEFHKANSDLRFSRIPVYQEDSIDQITGYILKTEVLSSIINEDTDLTLAMIKREIIIVNENTPLPDLFDHLVQKREHIALVIDEFGGMAGIVTMEDVIETLLGLEIVDELDRAEDMQALARKNWQQRAQRLGLIEELVADESVTEEPVTDENDSLPKS